MTLEVNSIVSFSEVPVGHHFRLSRGRQKFRPHEVFVKLHFDRPVQGCSDFGIDERRDGKVLHPFDDSEEVIYLGYLDLYS